MQDKRDPSQRMALHFYEQQLLTARRLARHKVRMRLAEGLGPDDPDPAPKRQAFSSAISQELYDSLLFYPSPNPIVEEIRTKLSALLGKQVEFTYPPGSTLKLAVREDGKLRHLTAEEQAQARILLRRITKDKIDKDIMSDFPGGIQTVV